MASAIGWLLDVTVDGNAATLWIKTTEGGILRLVDKYQPYLYILPTDESAGIKLFHALSQQPKITRVAWQNRFTDIFDHDGHGLRRLLSVYSESIHCHKALLRKLEKDPRVAQLFNTDLSYIQQYLFTRLKIEPTSKVKVEYDGTDLRTITKIDEHGGVEPPPFTILFFEVTTLSSLYSSDSHDVNDPIKQITARYQEEQEVTFADDEETILKDFCNYVLTNDPDILIATEQHCLGTSVLEYLIARMEELGIDIELGRTDNRNAIEGRAYLDSDSFDSIVGLIENARFACLPLSLVARYRISRLIDSRNCYELIQRGFVISRTDKLERIRTIEEIFACDKGGMIFSPRVGLHENVPVLDYENEYANLILKHNLSYERCITSKGLLPTVLESVLKRRIMFKDLQKSFPVNTHEWLCCEQRITVLKGILVSLYGTTGSFWNRLANMDTFEEINRLSREILIKSKDIVQGLGFELLYADTDSVFLKKSGTTSEDFVSVKDILTSETGLPITLEICYKFLVLLPLEADEKLEALKHYYGITHTNELIVRGIEARRHDAPNFIKDFQSELIYTFFDCKDSAEMVSRGYENALLLVTRTIDKVMTGELELKDLIVSKILRQDLYKYRSLFPHVSAALQLTETGIPLTRGDTIQYIYTDATHSNPLRRVTPVEFIDEGREQVYDKEKYREMLLEAAETVLGYFGFDRALYGDTSRTKNRKWWHQLREQRQRDIAIERS
ncbi:MAG TPA: DNA polymerase domain-containing protein [Candidatus Bathyarchaeia archaeon]|nr:DNA polymerase domain-containing protein [Candidatus Bathyarchaeia archaeon]